MKSVISSLDSVSRLNPCAVKEAGMSDMAGFYHLIHFYHPLKDLCY